MTHPKVPPEFRMDDLVDLPEGLRVTQRMLDLALEREKALQLQHTKDQERIEELTEALDEIQDRSTCPAHPTCPHGCEGIAREVLHTTESHTPTHPKEGGE